MNLKDLPSKEIMLGYHGKLIHSETMGWFFRDVEKDAEVPKHHHIHEQIMHIVSGGFQFTLGEATKVYEPISIVVIPLNTWHGGKAFTPCKLMDVFNPARDGYK